MRVSVLIVTVAAILIAFFIAYPLVLKPWHQNWGTTRTESTGLLPGDGLVPAAVGQVTHAITISTPPEAIWPWLMQIGQDRSGFYSYTRLENLIGCEMPEVHYLRPDWASRSIGETVWFGSPKHFNGQARMIAAVVDAPRAFVMVSANDWQRISTGAHGTEGSWAFNLIPVDAGHTRLIARMRSGPPKSVGASLMGSAFWDPMHFVMERKMLLTIKELAEDEGSGSDRK
jgi:hypothetical protein